MKTKSITLLSTATLALGAMVLPCSVAAAVETSSLNSPDVTFIKQSAANGMAEVKLAELAVKNAVRPEVKAFAAMIVKDHTKANETLAKLALSKGVELSKESQPAHTLTLDNLAKSTGTEFDTKFIAQMVTSHTTAVSNLGRISKEAKDTELKAYAQETLPKIKVHLEKAQGLSGNTGTGNTGTSNTGTSNTGTSNTGTSNTGTSNTGTSNTDRDTKDK